MSHKNKYIILLNNQPIRDMISSDNDFAQGCSHFFFSRAPPFLLNSHLLSSYSLFTLPNDNTRNQQQSIQHNTKTKTNKKKKKANSYVLDSSRRRKRGRQIGQVHGMGSCPRWEWCSSEMELSSPTSNC